MLTPFFERRQHCFKLNTLIIVEPNIIINYLSSFSKRPKPITVNTFCLNY